MVKKFLRRTWSRYSKLGKGRKKKQVWRKPRGRDNKMREKRKGYPKVVSIGYGKEKKLKEKIIQKKPVFIMNIKDLEKAKNKLIIIGKIGKKKKTEIVKKAKEIKIKIHNLNIEKFLRELEKKEKAKTEEKTKDKSKEKKEKLKEKKKEIQEEKPKQENKSKPRETEK